MERKPYSQNDIEKFSSQVFEGNKDRENSPERPYEFVDTNAIIISGPPGSGTTSVAESLREKLNLPEEAVVKIGQLRRTSDQELYEGKKTEDVLPADSQVERVTDNTTRELLRQRSPDNPVIIEAQLGGFIGKWEEDKALRKNKPIPNNVRVLVNADERVRAERVKMRWENSDGNEYSVDEWIERNRARQKKDLRSWKRTYRPLYGRNPHDKDVKDRDDQPVYDTTFDSTEIHYEDIADNILNFMESEGYIRRENKNEEEKS